MPGYLRGYVEREAYGDGPGWEFVTRVDPITGSQGPFKYVFFGLGFARVLDPVVHTEGFPKDVAPGTKAVLLSHTPGSFDPELHPEARFGAEREEIERLSPPPRHVSLDALRAFDWDSGVTEETRAAIPEDPRMPAGRALRLFELVDEDGTDYADWREANTVGGWRSDRATLAVDALLRGETDRYEGRTVTLRPLTRRELVPGAWFRLLETLSELPADVRFIVYHHP
jgi:hypothetical protein